MRRIRVLLLLFSVFLFVAVAHRNHAAEPAGAKPTVAADPSLVYKLADGPHPVQTVAKITLHDAARNKELQLRVQFPADVTAPVPLIVFSHGASASKDTYTDLTRHWATHGYVTIQPTHADSIQLRRENGERYGVTDALVDAVRNRQAAADRVADIAFVLDSLDEVEKQVPGLKGKIDRKVIGVGGHSFGALTAQIVGGATLKMDDGTIKNLADPRIAATLMLSGQGTGQMGMHEHSFDHCDRPMMSMTGSRDVAAMGQNPAWRKQAFDKAPPGEKYFLNIEGASHFSFVGPGFRFQAEDRKKESERIFEWIKVASIAYWDAELKHDAAAKAYLAGDSLVKLSGSAVELSRK